MRIIIDGGGSGSQTTELKKILNSIIDHNKPLLYIPLGMEPTDYISSFERIKNDLLQNDLVQINIDSIEMVSSFEDLSNKEFSNYSALYFDDGNAFKLLNGLKYYGVYSRIGDYINNNGIVYGRGVGASILGYDVQVCSNLGSNNVNLGDTKGYNVLGGTSIFPKYNKKYTNRSESENTAFNDRNNNIMMQFSITEAAVVALPEEDGLYVYDNVVTAIGTKNYFFYEDGVRKEYQIKKGTTKYRK